jgi:YD repeat-containing protein
LDEPCYRRLDGTGRDHSGTTQTRAFNYSSAGRLTSEINPAGELTSVIFPYGGELSWNYMSFTYNGGRTIREVGTRYLAADSAHATTWTYPITRPDAPNSVTLHSAMTLADASGIGAKTWNFTNSGSAWQLGLVSQFIQSASVGGTVLKSDTYTWSQDPAGNPYISAKSSASDPGSSNPQSALTTQTLDQYGNVTQSVLYPYNNTTTPIKTYVNTYLNSSTYTSNYIFNRLLSMTMTLAAGSPFTVTNSYDSMTNCNSAILTTPPTPCGGLVNPPGGGPTTDVDPSPIPLGQRGYLSTTTTPAVTTSSSIYTYGAVAASVGSDGSTTTASADASTNYAAPITIASQSYPQILAYNPWLAVTQATGANLEQISASYDIWGRPSGGTSPYGAAVGVGYSTSLPFTQTKTGPDGATITTLDGLGRAIRVDRGDTTSMHSSSATVYAPCACSPLAKIQKTSQPYVYGSSPSAWTTYTYDGLGRPLTVQQPDGASTTTYSYLGNLTTVTDPAGKWKQFTTDVSGNLVTVTEPDPANPPSGTVSTTYMYDWMNHVSCADMVRGGTLVAAYSYTANGVSCTSVYQAGTGVRQTRTFVYNNAGQLTSATNPENGTVSYTYNSDNTVQTKTDAKSQQTVYTYDSLKRLTMTQYYPTGTANPEDGCQRVT